MKKKTIAISGIMASSLIDGEINSVDFSKYPIPQDLTSVSCGGTLPDKLSASDGMGTLMLLKVGNNNYKLDNSVFNKLLKTNKNKLTDTNSLNYLISSGDISISQDVLDKVNNNITTDNTVNYSYHDILNHSLSNGNGDYDITNKNDGTKFNVYCDMDNGGRTKIPYSID
jgi:hypothetical protein